MCVCIVGPPPDIWGAGTTQSPFYLWSCEHQESHPHSCFSVDPAPLGTNYGNFILSGLEIPCVGNGDLAVSCPVSLLCSFLKGYRHCIRFISISAFVLVCSGCYNKNTISWVVYKQQIDLSQSGGSEVQDQNAGSLCPVREPDPGSRSLLLPYMVERTKELS